VGSTTLLPGEEHVTSHRSGRRPQRLARWARPALQAALALVLLGAGRPAQAQVPAQPATGVAKPAVGTAPAPSAAPAAAAGQTTATTPTNVATRSPQSVASAVQAFYDQTKSVEAEFFQTYYNRIYDKYDRSQGGVKFQKPGRMRWDYGAPNGKVIVSDGKRLVVYEPGEQSEPGQVFERAISDSELPQALAFLTGAGKLSDDFTFRLLDAAAQGFPTGYVLELLPKKPSPHYERILFFVDGDAKRTGLVHRVLIVDSAGNRNRIDFKAPKFNRNFDAKTFAWQPPKNARKVNP
jgi:outer membrane lipoprotein carrier protein